jgi:putative endonuclease
MMKNQILGASGEEAVMKYVEAKGFTVIDRNWRIKSGEIDLMREGTFL